MDDCRTVDETLSRALDEYLVASGQAGSVEAMDGLVRRWTPRLLRYCARVLGGSAEAGETARDVVQETWTAVLKGLPVLADPARFPAWIYAIATRRCADEIRSRTRARNRNHGIADGGWAIGAASAVSESAIDLEYAIRQLSPLQRAAVHLFYREGFNVREIASVLNIPEGTVKSRLHHARQALKDALHAQVPASGGHPVRTRTLS